MSNFLQKWSVASVFNEWGIARFEDAYDYGRGIRHISQSYWRVSQVAECIRKLGYNVDIERSIITGVWVIIGISKTDIHGEKTYYYGSDYSNSNTRNPREIVRNLDHIDLPLVGKRTIYQKVFERHCSTGNAPNYFTNFSQYIQDISTLFDSFFNQLQFNHAIEYGSAYYKISPLSSTYYNDGASTIGNTLPHDIVYALQNFRTDAIDFTTEPDYEFYIPHSMVLLACPGSDIIEHNNDNYICQFGIVYDNKNPITDNQTCSSSSNDSDCDHE